MSSTKDNAPKTLPSSASITEYLSKLPKELFRIAIKYRQEHDQPS